MPLCRAPMPAKTIGATGSMTRDQRRALEAQYAAQTRQQILDAGQWPASVPHFEESETA